ncbi:MAG: iron-containing alcohol dehydrogenase [Eubacteriales bacterium]|nr:iron-containing alcohol dehydrogenase [Eubacteriales bacterium]
MAHFSIPEHIVVGCGAIKEALPYLKRYGKRALIVTGKHVGKSPMMDSLVAALRFIQAESFVFDEITGEPTDEMITRGCKMYQEHRCDYVIGIGGGSPLDSAKAIAAMVVNIGNISDYMGKEIEGNIPPIVAIPTTAGTGSEATKFTVITDSKKGIKMLLKGEKLIPKLAIVDPDYTIDMPKSITAATGFDALTHAIEAYTSKKAMCLTDSYALSAIQRIVKYLPVAYQNGYDGQAREQMAIAALEAGICINNSSVTIVHGMSRPIGAMFHVPHGLSNAMLLRECMVFAMQDHYERFADIARAIGAANNAESDTSAAEKLIDVIDTLRRSCEIPTLCSYGISEEVYMAVVNKMANDAIASGSPGNTRREVTVADCSSLYIRAYRKN